MDLCIIGTGYVGLVTATCFAEMGHSVVCLDIDQKKVEALSAGRVPFYEPSLEELVQRNRMAGRLHFTLEPKQAIPSAQLCFIAVDTPPQPDGKADLTQLWAVCDEIARHMSDQLVIVNKSTVPVGTAAQMRERLEQLLCAYDKPFAFELVSNPEFLKEGEAVADCMKPDRIVIGVESYRAELLMRELYAPFMMSCERLLVMDCPSAEMTKYAANAFLASRVSLMNEIASLCEVYGADVDRVRRAVGADRRIGNKFLYPGCGFGGSCFPKDLRALRQQGIAHGVPTPLLDAIEQVNDRQKAKLGRLLIDYFAGSLTGRSVALLGLAFKPNTDDMREAPSLVFIRQLLSEGAYLRLFDPVAMQKASSLLGDHPQLLFCSDEYEAAAGADAIVLMTEWKQFRFLKLEQLLQLMAGSAFFDGRNQYEPERMAELGFDYYAIGRPHLLPRAAAWTDQPNKDLESSAAPLHLHQ